MYVNRHYISVSAQNSFCKDSEFLMESTLIIDDENRFGDSHVVGSLAAQADHSGYVAGYFGRSWARFSIAVRYRA